MGAKQNQDDDIIADINVTPLVDVMLVLLVIFMVTATYIVAQSIPVDLPEAGTGEDIVTTFAITITADGTFYLDGAPATDETIRVAIDKAKANNEDIRVIIAADKNVSHGVFVHAIDLVRKQGVSKFAINIDAQEE